jgi:hypothetical protein
MTFINVRKIHAAFTTFSICLLPIYAYAATDVVSELEQKLMNAKAAVESKSGLSGYTLQSVKFNGSFAATPLQLNNVIAEKKPYNATAQAICACTSGSYTLSSGAMPSVELGETFSSAESLSTDTTVKVEANYGAVSATATAEIKTNQEKTSSTSSKAMSASNVGTTQKKDLSCEKYNQPQCFIATGSTDKITYKDSQTGSEDIKYTYDVFPVNNGSTDFNAATFTATLFKAGGDIVPGPNVKLILYDKNGKVVCDMLPDNPVQQGSHQHWSDNDDCFRSPYNYKSATQYNISFGGSQNGTVGVSFQNKKAWTGESQTYNQMLAIPKGFQGSDLVSVSVRNNYFITTGADTQTKEIKIVDAIDLNTAKHTVSGTYNATDFTSLSMNMTSQQYSWQQLHKEPSEYTAGINECGKTLHEAKRTWKASCASPGKKVIMYKKWIKNNGPINLPGGGKIIGGKGQGGRDQK